MAVDGWVRPCGGAGRRWRGHSPSAGTWTRCCRWYRTDVLISWKSLSSVEEITAVPTVVLRYLPGKGRCSQAREENKRDLPVQGSWRDPGLCWSAPGLAAEGLDRGQNGPWDTWQNLTAVSSLGTGTEHPEGLSCAAQGLSVCGMCGRPSPPSVRRSRSTTGPASSSRSHHLQGHLLPSQRGPCSGPCGPCSTPAGLVTPGTRGRQETPQGTSMHRQPQCEG